MEGQRQGMERPVDVVTTVHCRQEKQIGIHRRRAVSGSALTTPGVTGLNYMKALLTLSLSSLVVLVLLVLRVECWLRFLN